MIKQFRELNCSAFSKKKNLKDDLYFFIKSHNKFWNLFRFSKEIKQALQIFARNIAEFLMLTEDSKYSIMFSVDPTVNQ